MDTAAKSVKLSKGNSIKYDSLILATGGDPRIFDWPGKHLENIFILRDANHAKGIENALTEVSSVKQDKPNVIVVGSSFIGMEAASILAKQASVTVVGMEEVPFERVLGHGVGKALGNLTERNGVTLKMKSLVDKFEPSCM